MTRVPPPPELPAVWVATAVIAVTPSGEASLLAQLALAVLAASQLYWLGFRCAASLAGRSSGGPLPQESPDAIADRVRARRSARSAWRT